MIVQAGASETGSGGRGGDRRGGVLCAALAGARAEILRRLKGRMASYGRDPDQVKIMPGVMASSAAPPQEAQDQYEHLQDR